MSVGRAELALDASAIAASGGAVAASRLPPLRGGFTVEAWVNAREGEAERLQSLVSQWAPRGDLMTFDAFDAGGTDGLDSTGYFGAVFDGRYVYFVPEQHGRRVHHGIVLRYDTHGDFHRRDSYRAYDAGSTAGLDTKGYYGAAFDGRYVYFVPRKNGRRRHGFVLRLDTRGDFLSPESWDAFDAGVTHCSQGAAFDGRYLYFAPGYAARPDQEDETVPSSHVVRFDTRAEFRSPSSWTVFDASDVGGGRAGCFDGAVFDGRFVYFVPLGGSPVLRLDSRGDFRDAGSWAAFDAASLGMRVCVGAVFDGRHVYFVPYGQGCVVRLDVRADFLDPMAWSAFEVGADPSGYDGGFFDGRHVHFVPFVHALTPRQGYLFHGNWLRHDPSRVFTDPSAWATQRAEEAGGLKTIGYNAGAFDGRFFYCAPWRDGTKDGRLALGVHGRVLRVDTLGTRGAFSLRFCDYGHNGGLCAAVPGPSFLVNTASGPRGVAAHRALGPGRHHLVGTWGAGEVSLYVDGQLAARREADGDLVACNEPLNVGLLEGGMGRFAGEVSRVRIVAGAWSAEAVGMAFKGER